MKHFLRFYIILGSAVCLWLTVAAFAGWKAPNFGMLDGGGFGSSGYHYGGRGSGGFWGGGK